MAIYNETNKQKWTKDGRHWYYIVYYKDIHGSTKQKWSKMYKNQKEAEQAEALFLLKRNSPINQPFLLVAKAYFEELYTIRKESTVYSYINAYSKHIEPYFKDFNIAEINISTINFWRLEMTKKRLKTAYLNKLYEILKSIFDYSMKNYGLESNPVSTVGRFQQKNEEVISDKEKLRYITYENFNKFISVINDITWKTFFLFLYYTGMRKGEIQALTWNDIDFNDNEIIVNKTLSVKTHDLYKITSTKNNLNRKIKMNKTLIDQLTNYKNKMIKYSDFSESWFVFGCSRFLPQTSIDRYKHKYFLLADVPEITIHEFRHSHVSLLINEYIKSGQTDTTKFFLMMSNRMGHSIDVMQKTYMHLFPTIQNEIVDILDNL